MSSSAVESVRFAEDGYWSLPLDGLVRAVGGSAAGLSSPEAKERAHALGAALRPPGRVRRTARLLARQFSSPIVLTLLGAAILSYVLSDATDAAIILLIVMASGILGFAQEARADEAVAQLLALVQVRSRALRDGAEVDVPLDAIVPGDIVVLNAGDMIPGDGRLIEGRALFVGEAALTGETFPVEKVAGVVPTDAPPARRTNCLFLGTSVVSGTGRMLVVRVGRATEFGRVSESLRREPPESDFERGIRRFGALLVEVTLTLVFVVFAVNVALHRPWLESLLFALAIAVGLTPQLLPAIISVNLAHGARRMAQRRVIVRRPASIEDLGAMTILCADKTGTLTEGRVALREAVDVAGCSFDRIAQAAALNAGLQSGYENPVDRAILAAGPHADGNRKIDEAPYDFSRKRLSVLVDGPGGRRLITKGAMAEVLSACSGVEMPGGRRADIAEARERIDALFASYSSRGLRVLGVAERAMPGVDRIEPADESDMTLLGLLVFDDPPRAGVVESLEGLRKLGIELKLITGDNALVAAETARRAGLVSDATLTGPELRLMSDPALVRRACEVSVFAEIEPNQKERIVLALKKAGHAVGFLGDGINDAPALHAADVGISVSDAADVAREAAQVVLLEKDLNVLQDGVREGRMTFTNTLKYVYMATSANFGNMLSMAAASLFLPFLPLLPKQVLLTNLLTDLPEMAIASDRVDPEMVERPRRWDVRSISRFMIVFGLVSSVFDFLTFGVLLFLIRADEVTFRTGWFVESVVSASLIVLVLRTRRPLFRSPPGRLLLVATMAVVAVTIALPYTPAARALGFRPLPPMLLVLVAAIVALFQLSAEVAKRVYFRLEDRRSSAGGRPRG